MPDSTVTKSLFDHASLLHESELRFRAMAHIVPVMMWVADVDGARTFFNKPWLDFTGRSSKQEVEDGWKENLHPEDRAHCLGTYSAAVRAQKRFRTEYRIKRHNGQYRWILETGVPRFEERRNCVGFVGSAIDITERKRAKELEVSQKKFLEMVTTGKAMPETLDFLTLAIEKQSVEAQCAVMLLDERKQELFFGSAPSLPKSYRSEIEGIAVGRGNGSCAVAAFRKRTVVVSDIVNNPVWANVKDLALTHEFRACASVPIMANGHVLGTCAMYYREERRPGRYDMKLMRIASQLLGIAIERRRAEEALQRAEVKYRGIFENAVEGIFQTTPDGRFIAANPAMARMLGYESPLELITHRVDIERQHYVEPGRRAEFQRLIQERGIVERWELQVYRKDGSKIWTSENVRVVCDEDGMPLYYEGTVEDVTYRKRAEEAQRQLLLRVVTAQEDEQRRLSRELHDHMAQSLTALTLGLKSLEKHCVSETSAARLREMQHLANQLSKEVRTLATHLRPPALDDLGLQTALSNYIGEWSKRSRVTSDYHCNGLINQRLPEVIETTVYRIIQEALTNVLKHAEAKTASVIVEYRGHSLRAIVEDDGCGFEVDAMMMRGPAAERRLGLLGMQERATLVGGTLNIESSPGAGTTVLLQLPVR